MHRLYRQEYYSSSDQEAGSAEELPLCSHQHFRQTAKKPQAADLFRRWHGFSCSGLRVFCRCCLMFDFARFLIPRPACTDALIDVESRLSSAPVLGAAQTSKIFFRVPSSRRRQKQLYTVWCGRNLAGKSLQRAPLRASHMMSLRCARISFCGRPVCEIGISGRISSHSLSVSS